MPHPNSKAKPDLQLYDLPRRALDRAQRRSDYDKMKALDSPGGGFAGGTGLEATRLLVQSAVAAKTKPQKDTEKEGAVVTHSAEDVASLPLLRPFKIKKPSENAIVSCLINEQNAADTLNALLRQLERMQKELDKAKKEGEDDKKNDKNAKGGGKKAKRNSKRDKGGTNAKSDKVIEIESNLEAMKISVDQCRGHLGQIAGCTRTFLQTEYTKLAVTMDQESAAYEELEEAINFLCPEASEGNEQACHEARLAYVKELLPVTKKVGERNKASSLVQLPYLQKFQCDDAENPIVEALIEEMHQLALAEGVGARLEKQTSDAAKMAVLRHVEDELDRREVVTSELVRKHYRKRSIKLHPDRNGEHMRPIFEEFTDARTVLADVSLRQSYLRGMLGVLLGNLGQIPESHDAWNHKHRPDKAEGGLRSHRKKERGGGEGRTLQLEGGLHQQIPKGVVLHHRREKKAHVVGVSVHALRPLHEFYARVRSVKVELRSAENANHVINVGRPEIVKNIRVERQGPILENEIPVGEISLSPGNWEAVWSATLDTVGTDPLNPQNATESDGVTTRPSAAATFHVADPVRLQHQMDYALAEYQCKVVRGELSNTLHKLRTNQVDSASMSTPARFGHFHQVLVRARKRCHNLGRLVEVTGKPSAAFDDLTVLLGEARQVFAALEVKADAAKKRKEKRDDTKRFKAFIASILESDDPVMWMKEVSEAQLHRQGGDVNRLYQLFIEGKGTYTLMIDSEMYKQAATREDIFTAKQCKDLAKRGEEVAEQEAKEEEEAAAAEAKRKKEEEEREKMQKEAELREKWALVGQNATVGGLTSEKGMEMNHQLAKVSYYVVERDRFEVVLHNSGEKAYLKRENLTAYYGHVPPKKQQKPPLSPERKANPTETHQSSSAATTSGAWNCDSCTFENDDASTQCSMCTNPRTSLKKAHQRPSTEAGEEKKEPEEEKAPAKKSSESSPEDSNAMEKKTIYVRSSHTKKLTGKRGRKKKELVKKSGTEDIEILSSAIDGNHVPVHLTGSRVAVLKAVALIQETIGMDNVTDKIKHTAPSPPAPTTPAVVSPPAAKAPAPIVPAPVAPAAIVPGPFAPNTAEKKPPTSSNPSFLPPGMFPSFDKPVEALANGIKQVSLTESETQPTSQYSFGDAFLPRGLMDMSQSTGPSNALPPELPSEIGINSQQMTKESITEASISSFNDRSSGSKTYSNISLNENDPLLAFLRSQQQCIKGSVDEFFVWLVKSEDIDSMAALKEAVEDDEYLNETLKAGNGSSGLKGFKRKAFQRAVLDYEDVQPSTTGSTSAMSSVKLTETAPLPTQNPSTTGSTSTNGMSSHAFLPTNLFGSDDPSSGSLNNVHDPEELVCPIGLGLMTVDPVLAADGVTYERSHIENWFQTKIAKIRMAQENLKWNPQSDSDRKLVEGGVVSPAYGTMMTSLALTPNTSVRNMARAYQERKAAVQYSS